MMADKSTAHRDAVLNVMRATALSAFTPYVSLHTSDPGLTGANEVTGDAYVRIAATFGAPGDGSTGRKIANSAVVTFPEVDSTENRTVTYAGIWDAEESGTFRYKVLLAQSRVINAGLPATFEIGDLEIEEA
jgi:hypothetical protein